MPGCRFVALKSKDLLQHIYKANEAKIIFEDLQWVNINSTAMIYASLAILMYIFRSVWQTAIANVESFLVEDDDNYIGILLRMLLELKLQKYICKYDKLFYKYWVKRDRNILSTSFWRQASHTCNHYSSRMKLQWPSQPSLNIVTNIRIS